MKDAVGSTMLVYIVIIVVVIVGSIVIASNMYTSAYKAKNNIISTINRYYQINGDTDCFNNNAGNCITSINGTLKNMGYHVKGNLNDYCKKKSVLNKVNKIAEEDGSVPGLIYPSTAADFNGYCIFKNSLSTDDYYYTVVTFSHLNINALGIDSLFSTPVYGETRTFY